MKKLTFVAISLVLIFVFVGAMAEDVVEMPFGLKWTESFVFDNGITFGMTNEDVNKYADDDAEYHYNDNGELCAVVYAFPFKKYNDSYSDYENTEKQLSEKYGDRLDISLVFRGESVSHELVSSGESKHTDRMILEGKDGLITVEHYLLGTYDPSNRDHYRILVFSKYEGNQRNTLLLWHLQKKKIY